MDELTTDSKTETVAVPVENPENAALLEEMAKAGILLGRSRARTNPRMRKYVFTNRNGFEIFDLNQTLQCLEEAKTFLKEAAKSGKPILVVGTTPASQELVRQFGEKFSAPYVTERWLGGTLTNFDTLSKRLNHYMTLKADKAAGRLEKYTKQERTEIGKQIERLTRLFGGMEKLNMQPATVIVVGADEHEIAIKEANRMKIPVIAIANTSANPDIIDYCIPANDNSRSSIAWILGRLEEAVASGQKESKVVAAKK